MLFRSDNYLFFQNENEKPVVVNGIEPKSWALDQANCRLWVTSRSIDSGLQSFQFGKLLSQIEYEGEIVSDFERGNFFTRSSTGKLQMRSFAGEVMEEVVSANTPFVQKVVWGEGSQFWSLNKGQLNSGRDSLGLTNFKMTGEVLKNIEIEAGREIGRAHV